MSDEFRLLLSGHLFKNHVLSFSEYELALARAYSELERVAKQVYETDEVTDFINSCKRSLRDEGGCVIGYMPKAHTMEIIKAKRSY